MEQEAEEAAKKKKVEEEEEKARKEKEEEEKTGNATEEEEKKKKQEEEDNEEEEKKNAEEKPKRSAAIGRGDKRLTRTLRVFINKKSGKDQFQSGLGSVIVTTRKQSAPKVVFDLQWKGSFASPPKPQQNCVSPVTLRG